jgi:hypothetical protein
MVGIIWSVGLAAIGILGLVLAGRKSSIGWAVGLSAQALWVVYALITKQYGFILSAAAYGYVYFTNWRKWKKEEVNSS